MTTKVLSWCDFCKHRKGMWNCRAFPDGIPEDILYGMPHSIPVDGQGNSLVFTLDMRKQAEFDDMQPYLVPAEGLPA